MKLMRIEPMVRVEVEYADRINESYETYTYAVSYNDYWSYQQYGERAEEEFHEELRETIYRDKPGAKYGYHVSSIYVIVEFDGNTHRIDISR